MSATTPFRRKKLGQQSAIGCGDGSSGKALDPFIHHIVRHRDRQPAPPESEPDNLLQPTIDFRLKPLRLEKAVLADDPQLADVIDKKGRDVVIADKEDIQWEIARPAEKLVLAFLKGYAGLLKKGETLFRKPPGFLDRNFQAPVISR